MLKGSEWILKRDVRDLQVWRNTLPGMWAWLLQRVSAVFLLVFLPLHFLFPYRRPIQFLLLTVAAFHASLGVRVLLIDLGTDIRTQRILVWIFVSLAVFGILLIWNYLPLGG